ncbi:DENN domain protein [Dictyocaulus viviparus]|uniref:DENN domain protein n=1 Tax=Dictyocaulus viviparus TaxID=29172 RepID=A0A0D8XQ74_DICVI|nr:DENN domain protein [Dictyocaulus viviparus]
MSVNVPPSSRHRTDIATLFDVFCEVGTSLQDGLPIILTKYPEDYNDEAVLKNVCHFSFPCGLKEVDSEAVQLFSFVLTDSQSQYTFGFCRYTPRNNTCICILSGFSWPGVFYKVLNHVSLIMNNGTQNDLDTILTRIYHTDIPNVGEMLTFECQNGMHKLEVKIPDITKLPTLREDKFMLEFYNAVSPRQMLAVYASLLKERRIIFTGRKLSQLSSCIHAASTLLFPMFWQSIFIPVLPESLRDMIMAPMPFLIGVPKQVMESSMLKDLGEVVIVDLEDKTLQSAHNDVADMPSEVVMFLKCQLKNSSDMGDSMSRSFLQANVLLFGGYRMGFVRRESTGVVHWEKEKFVREQRPSLQPFLSSLIGSDGVQYLERFVEERTRSLNSGLPISDEFETEIANMDKLKVQAVSPEVIHQAMQSVKENASDVIGALKDKMTGMQISAKLNKLTPKEIRKPKNWPLKKSVKGGFEPMSFGNVQWEEPKADSDSSRGSSPCPDQSSHAHVTDLIDFDTPIDDRILVSGLGNFQIFNPIWHARDIHHFKRSATSNSLLTSPMAPSSSLSTIIHQPTAPVVTIPVGKSTFYASSIDPFFDPFKTPASPTERAVTDTEPKNSWETFD